MSAKNWFLVLALLGARPVFAQEQNDVPAGDPGWSLAAGVFGVISSTAVLSMSIASEVTRGHKVSLYIGSAATVLHLASVPITDAGGRSGRRSGAKGAVGLRIASWVAYGISTANAVALIALGIMNSEPPAGLIASTGVLGFTSGILMAADALYVHKQADRSRWMPGFSATRGGGMVALSTTF
jgi:hypothetical protein